MRAWILLLAACGGRSSNEGASPTAIYGKDDQGCPVLRPITSAASEMQSKQFGEAVAVVELFHQSECSGLGGEYILAREVEGTYKKTFWIGAHGCRRDDRAAWPASRYGVVRYNQTAGIFRIPEGVCVGFPGEPPGASTDVSTRVFAAFETLDAARTFAATLEP